MFGKDKDGKDVDAFKPIEGFTQVCRKEGGVIGLYTRPQSFIVMFLIRWLNNFGDYKFVIF